ncbi:Retrovirus-related Pol polyprotein from transposon TNT 1-94 [Senna tora]|uniref:Retrovirus-related Pol polyprotein from transposon TNT 1-94 n=1 Tax=Senna tora TaxID=362788 RepID=A0A835CHP4_9FABA|nr:Retrovirus-related Pol polyprotein from transposon TNT 1-94 [Senna tora]
MTEDKSFLLWHKRLGHISKERVDRLIKDQILPSLDYSDMGTCVDCAKGKLTKTEKKSATRSEGLLELVHTDISGPYSTTLCGKKYFITFIGLDNYVIWRLVNDNLPNLANLKCYNMEVDDAATNLRVMEGKKIQPLSAIQMIYKQWNLFKNRRVLENAGQHGVCRRANTMRDEDLNQSTGEGWTIHRLSKETSRRGHPSSAGAVHELCLGLQPPREGDNLESYKKNILLRVVELVVRNSCHCMTCIATSSLSFGETSEKIILSSDNYKASTSIAQLSSMKYTGTKAVREHIMQMRDIVAQLKSLDIEITDSFLVLLILNSLPSRFGRFKITYNTHNENWPINELLSMCVQEEGMLNSEKGEGSNEAHIVTNTNKQGHKGKNKKNELAHHSERDNDAIKYTESGQKPGPFAKFLQEQGIVPQYTMSGSPDMNGELKEGIGHCWTWVPTKVVLKTPFEIWKGWKPSLNHIRVWGCPTEFRVYNPHEKKLDPRTISAYFVGYAERSKGHKFYCPTHTLKFVESRNAKFLENDTFSGSDQFHDLVNENDHEVIPTTSGQGEIVVLIDSHPIEVIREHNVVSPIPSDHVERNFDILEEAPHNAQEEPQEEFHIEQHQPPQEVELRRSQRAKKPAISNDYMVIWVRHLMS